MLLGSGSSTGRGASCARIGRHGHIFRCYDLHLSKWRVGKDEKVGGRLNFSVCNKGFLVVQEHAVSLRRQCLYGG